MIVTFFGHRAYAGYDALRGDILSTMCAIAEQNPQCEFFCGGKGDFDGLCENCIDELKITFPHIKKILILPYFDVEYQQEILEYIKSKFDEMIFPPPCENCPPKYAWLHRNRWMVDNADIILSGVRWSWGGAAHASEYARKKNKKIIQF